MSKSSNHYRRNIKINSDNPVSDAPYYENLLEIFNENTSDELAEELVEYYRNDYRDAWLQYVSEYSDN